MHTDTIQLRARFRLPVRVKIQSVTMPPSVSPSTPAKNTTEAKIADFLQLQVIAVQEVLRNPAQEQPQGPAVAEVHDRDRRTCGETVFPTARRPLSASARGRTSSSSVVIRG